MSGVPEVNQTEVNKVQKRKLPFGHYKTSFKTSDSEDVICKPLNQDELEIMLNIIAKRRYQSRKSLQGKI